MAFVLAILLVVAMPAKASLEGLQVGMKGPEFKLQDFDGKLHDFQEFFSQGTTVIFFWSTWSLKSAKALETFETLHRKYGGKGLTVVAVTAESQEVGPADLERIQARVKETGLTMKVLLDPGLQMFHDYGVIAIPTTVIMDSGRVILYELSGFPLVGSELMVEYLDGLMQGKEPSEKHLTASGYKPNKEAVRFINLGRKTMQKRTMFEMAESWFKKAAEADPKYAAPLVELARFKTIQGNPAEAENYLKQGLALEPSNTAALCEMAKLRLEAGQIEESISLNEKAVEQDFYFTPSHYLLGLAYARAGKKELSSRHFDEALATNPFSPGIFIFRAETRLAGGDAKSAAADYDKALSLLLNQ